LKGQALQTNDIRFYDGAAYERYMGVWSQLVGHDWLAAMQPDDLVRLKTRLAERLPTDELGCISYTARAHAVKWVGPQP
jgi:hypothetical protein